MVDGLAAGSLGGCRGRWFVVAGLTVAAAGIAGAFALGLRLAEQDAGGDPDGLGIGVQEEVEASAPPVLVPDPVRHPVSDAPVEAAKPDESGSETHSETGGETGMEEAPGDVSGRTVGGTKAKRKSRRKSTATSEPVPKSPPEPEPEPAAEVSAEEPKKPKAKSMEGFSPGVVDPFAKQ